MTAPRNISIQVDPIATAETVRDGAIAFLWPTNLAGYAISTAEGRVYTAGVTGQSSITVTKWSTAGAAATAYTLAITSGVSAASTGAGTLANRTFTTGDLCRVDVKAIHSGTAASGLWLSFYCIKP